MAARRTWLLETAFFGLATFASWQARGKPQQGRLNKLQHATLAMFHVCLSVRILCGPGKTAGSWQPERVCSVCRLGCLLGCMYVPLDFVSTVNKPLPDAQRLPLPLCIG